MSIAHKRRQQEPLPRSRAPLRGMEDVGFFATSCGEKFRYRNRDEARAAMRSLQSEEPPHKASMLRIYKCRFCHNFHVGHDKYRNRLTATTVAKTVELVGEAERVAAILALTEEGENR